MPALSAGVRLLLLCTLALNVATISSQPGPSASIIPTPSAPHQTQTFIILIGALFSSVVVIILLYSVFCTALAVTIMVRKRRRELQIQNDTALRKFNNRPTECSDTEFVHRPSECGDNLYDDTVPNRAETNDDPEYAAPCTGRSSDTPQSNNLYYTTVVRQEGQKVSVKIKASAVTDLD